ncbi:MAG: ferritin-like domain-containing protein [Phycisphaerales bacterium]
MNQKQTKAILDALHHAYNMEIETVINYLAASINLDGVLAQEIKESLAGDITEELEHAKMLANRIKILGGRAQGSMELKMAQKAMQPSDDLTDVVSVIKGVIAAEDAAIKGYEKLIEVSGDGVDPVTEDLAIELMGDEQEHRREFVGFLRGFEKHGFDKK